MLKEITASETRDLFFSKTVNKEAKRSANIDGFGREPAWNCERPYVTTFMFSVNWCEGYLQKEQAKGEIEGGEKRVMTIEELL